MIWLKEESGKMTKKMNREMAVVTYLFMILFLIMAGYIVYFVVHDSDKVLNNPQNKRQELLAKASYQGKHPGIRRPETCLYQDLKKWRRDKSLSLWGTICPCDRTYNSRCDRTGIHRRVYDADKQYQSVERDVK